MDKIIFQKKDLQEFENIFGNEGSIVNLVIEKLLTENPNNKELKIVKSSFNKMIESYFQFINKGEFHGCDNE